MKQFRTTILILGALLMAACSSDTDLPPQEDGTSAILFGHPRQQGSINWQAGRIGTRASGTEVESDIPRNIGVFAFGDGRNTTYIFRNQKVYYEEGREYKGPQTPNGLFTWRYGNKSDWPYTTDPTGVASVQQPWEQMRYRFFAYSPWAESDHVKVEAENYAGFNTFRWAEIPGFSSDDYMLSNRIVECDNTGNTYTTNDSIVKFEMRHILSRIRFFFRMSPKYRNLRKIELNSLTVLTAGKVKSATFNFKNNAWDEIVHWSTEEPGDADPVTLTNVNADYEIPSTGYPADPYASVYVYPQSDFREIRLQLNYTVYDSASNVTRRASVTNIVSLPNWTLLSGYYYDIKINIVPAYLYVLSDEDQDFDGWVIIKDTP